MTCQKVFLTFASTLNNENFISWDSPREHDTTVYALTPVLTIAMVPNFRYFWVFNSIPLTSLQKISYLNRTVKYSRPSCTRGKVLTQFLLTHWSSIHSHKVTACLREHMLLPNKSTCEELNKKKAYRNMERFETAPT